MTGCTSGGYDQLETSPEAIEQELRPTVCECRQTDLRQIIDKSQTHIVKYYSKILRAHLPMATTEDKKSWWGNELQPQRRK